MALTFVIALSVYLNAMEFFGERGEPGVVGFNWLGPLYNNRCLGWPFNFYARPVGESFEWHHISFLPFALDVLVAVVTMGGVGIACEWALRHKENARSQSEHGRT
jgi:hypothetical protein